MSFIRRAVMLLLLVAIGANADMGPENCGGLNVTLAPKDLHKVYGDWVLVSSFGDGVEAEEMLKNLSSSFVEFHLLPDNHTLSYIERNLHNNSCTTYIMKLTIPSDNDHDDHGEDKGNAHVHDNHHHHHHEHTHDNGHGHTHDDNHTHDNGHGLIYHHHHYHHYHHYHEHPHDDNHTHNNGHGHTHHYHHHHHHEHTHDKGHGHTHDDNHTHDNGHGHTHDDNHTHDNGHGHDNDHTHDNGHGHGHDHTHDHDLHFVSPYIMDKDGVISEHNDSGIVNFFETEDDSLIVHYKGDMGNFLLSYRREGHHQELDPVEVAHANFEKLADCEGISHNLHYTYDGVSGFCHEKSAPEKADDDKHED